MSLLDRALPEPSFVDRDVDKIVSDIVAQFEAETGRTLYPAQVERLQTNIIAYRESLIREAIQDAAKLNLLRYSRKPVIDMLGELVGVGRLDAAPAGVVLQFTFAAAAMARTIPAGTLAKAGEVAFATSVDLAVPAGAVSAAGTAACAVPGLVGNGFVAGQVNALAAPVAGFPDLSVTNTTTSAGGAEEEGDDELRHRIAEAPERFSTAGSVGAYRFHAKSAWPGIIDVAVLNPEMAIVGGVLVSLNGVPPGQVRLYPLMRDGLPSQPVLDAVLAACSGETVRPVCDQVQVIVPETVHLTLSVELTLFEGSDSAVALEYGQAAADAYVAAVRRRLGVDVVRSQIDDAMHVTGVYKVNVLQPAVDVVLQDHQWPVFDAVSVSVAGVSRG